MCYIPECCYNVEVIMVSIAIGVIVSFIVMCCMLCSEHRGRELAGFVGAVIIVAFIVAATVIGSGLYG